MQIHLNTYGTYLHVKDQLFEIKIKKDKVVEKHQVSAHKVKSIWIGQGIAISAESVRLAMRHNIDIVFLENNGTPIARVWHSKLGSTTKIRKRQLETSLNSGALKYTKFWLGRKLENHIIFIKNLKRHRSKQQKFLDDKITKIEALKQSLDILDAAHLDEVADTIRGLEGTAGRLYFETLSKVLREPYKFSGRSFRPAKDPFNAFLNYAYGVLYGRVEKALILAGVDPYVGFLHRDDYNFKSMVYDFIEPYRVFADKVVFSLFSGKKVNQSHTDQIANGFQLNKEGKVLLIEQLNKYLEQEKVRYRGRNQTRSNIIQADAHQFAHDLIA
ncbi:MAG: CRISPR-associated endonuclease Cas1 [Saprospiraceae bacterium]|jgi:CRISPR-associated protein Cas1|nr:CRISPR-associated endonuclease Cas1 [Saprospiraceae bacterium]